MISIQVYEDPKDKMNNVSLNLILPNLFEKKQENLYSMAVNRL